MKIAFFSDIHSNFPALCGAFASAERHKVSKIFCAGDVVGIGPHPIEVVRLLKERNVQTIRGNLDRKIVNLIKKEKGLKKLLKNKKKASLAWTALQMGEEEKSWLLNLPPEINIQIEGVSFLIVHGSLLSDADYIYPSITSIGLSSKMKDKKTDVLVCGHSHIPFIKVVNNIRVINCGSVGKPIDGDPRGSYILVDISKSIPFHSEIIRFNYNTDNLVRDLEERKVPGISSDEFKLGVKVKGD